MTLIGVFYFPATLELRGETRLPVSALTIQTSSGEVSFRVELADTPDARQKGLMYREALAPDTGMLFDYHEPQIVAMWMKNTLIPLDMLFISASGKVVRIEQNTVPHSTEIIRSGVSVRAVLELRGGTASSAGIKPGDAVVHPIFADAQQGHVAGQATVIDGDTLEIEGHIVDLFNVDAPELDQICDTLDGLSYPCGQRARYELSSITAGQDVVCHGDKLDRDGRLNATCFVDDMNISREMVARGWAVVFRRQKFDEDYMRTERLARDMENGLWRGHFVLPWDWRAGFRE